MTTNQTQFSNAAHVPEAHSYTNIEIVNLVAVALAYGLDSTSDPVITRSWRALDDTFHNGHKRGYEEGYNAGLIAAGHAEVAATHIIEGIARRDAADAGRLK